MKDRPICIRMEGADKPETRTFKRSSSAITHSHSPDQREGSKQMEQDNGVGDHEFRIPLSNPLVGPRPTTFFYFETVQWSTSRTMPLPNERSPGSVGALIKRFQRASEADAEQQEVLKERGSRRMSGEGLVTRIPVERRKSDKHGFLDRLQPSTHRLLSSTSPLSTGPSNMDPAFANTSSKDVERASDPLSPLAAAAADRNLAIIHVSANARTSKVDNTSNNVIPASSSSLNPPPAERNNLIDDGGAVIDHEPPNLPAPPTASRASSPLSTNDQPHGAIVGSLHALPPPPLPIMTDPTGLISSQHNDHSSNDTQKGTEEKEVSTITRTDGNEKPAVIQAPVGNEGYPTTNTKKSLILEPPTSLKAESGNNTDFEKLMPPEQRITNESAFDCNLAASNSADVDADEGASSSSLLMQMQEHVQGQKLQGAGGLQGSGEGGNEPTPHIDPRAKVGRSEIRNQVGQQQRPPIRLEKLTTTAGKQTATTVAGKGKSDAVVAASRPLQLGERRSASRIVPTSSCGMVGITRAANPGKQATAVVRGTVRQLLSSSTCMMAAQAGCKPFPVGAHAVESATVRGNVPAVRSGLRALPAPSRLNGMAQRQTRDSGAFAVRDNSASALASFKDRTTCSTGTGRPLAQSQRGITLPRQPQTTRSQFVKLPSHPGPVPSLSDTAPRNRERTSLYAPTASSLAKARVRDAIVAVTTAPQTVRKSMQRIQASQGNS